MKLLPITAVQPFMPHRDKMMLINTVLSYDDERLVATAELNERHIFVENNHFPSWAAMELMAQSVAAWSGCLADDAGEAIRLGFLLGSRRFKLYFDELLVPSTVLIKINVSLQDSNGFGVFDTELWLSDESNAEIKLLAEGALNVYSPKEDIVEDE